VSPQACNERQRLDRTLTKVSRGLVPEPSALVAYGIEGERSPFSGRKNERPGPGFPSVAIIQADLNAMTCGQKNERPVGGPAARGHGVMEVQKLEVPFSGPASWEDAGCRIAPRIHSDSARSTLTGR
jgi:hypothetical protein